MRALMGGLLLFFGVGLVLIAWRGWKIGRLPSGGRGMRHHLWVREETPTLFTIFAAGYFAAGVALTIYGCLVLLGSAAPLPLR